MFEATSCDSLPIPFESVTKPIPYKGFRSASWFFLILDCPEINKRKIMNYVTSVPKEVLSTEIGVKYICLAYERSIWGRKVLVGYVLNSSYRSRKVLNINFPGLETAILAPKASGLTSREARNWISGDIGCRFKDEWKRKPENEEFWEYPSVDSIRIGRKLGQKHLSKGSISSPEIEIEIAIES